MSAKAVGHGIEYATYALAPIGQYGVYRPSMSCLCGFTTGKIDGKWAGANNTWEETGAEFDAHLTEAPR